MIATERDKCQKFEEGLNYEIRSKITTSDLESFSKLKTAAIWAERLEKEKLEQ